MTLRTTSKRRRLRRRWCSSRRRHDTASSISVYTAVHDHRCGDRLGPLLKCVQYAHIAHCALTLECAPELFVGRFLPAEQRRFLPPATFAQCAPHSPRGNHGRQLHVMDDQTPPVPHTLPEEKGGSIRTNLKIVQYMTGRRDSIILMSYTVSSVCVC